MTSEEQVRELAYSIWEKEGRPEGKDLEHYLAARRILEEKQASKSPASAPNTPHPAQGNGIPAAARPKTMRRKV